METMSGRVAPPLQIRSASPHPYLCPTRITVPLCLSTVASYNLTLGLKYLVFGLLT